VNRTILGYAIFFRATSYQLSTLLSLWHAYVLDQGQTVEVAGRCVLLGDHTHVPKDGGRMPGVVSMRETSETQSRPSYFRGQCWGALGLLVGSIGACFCLPLELRIHQGFVHLGEQPARDSPVGLGERVVRMALAFAVAQDRPAWLILDAFFPTAVVFRLARSVYCVALKQPYLHILVRAKKNYVGYVPAPLKPPHRPGPQARYGQKIYLKECFDHRHLFHTTECTVYGHCEMVQLMALSLLWKPLGEPVLFIFAITSRGPLMLMSSDLALSPATALELYCTRTRIEIMFAMLKHLLGAFRFRFWTKYLPKHPRRPRANKYLQAPAAEHLAAVTACWNACEVFVGCAAMAHGLLQLIALRFESPVWQHHTLYLRTQSRALPSERTVKQVVAPQLLSQFIDLGQHGLIAKIQRCFDRAENDKEPDFRLSA
jgi:hypothetical protein